MKNFKAAIIVILVIVWYFNVIQSRKTDELKYDYLIVSKQRKPFYLSTNAEKLKNKNVPLFIFLHEMDNNWPTKKTTKNYYYIINSFAEKMNFIAVFPRGSKGSCSWDNNKYRSYYCWETIKESDRNFIKHLANKIIDLYKVDPNRIYLTGFSNGAYFTANYLFRHHDDDFAGYGINSGNTHLLQNDSIKDMKNKVPVFLSVGKKDLYEFPEVKLLNETLLKQGWQQNKNLKYVVYNEKHELNREIIQKEIEFLLKGK